MSAEGVAKRLADVSHTQYQVFTGSFLGLYTVIILTILVLLFCFGHE